MNSPVTTKGISRRNLLFGSAALAAGTAAFGLVGCGPESDSKAASSASAPSGKVGEVKNGVKAKGTYQVEKAFPVLADADGFDDSLITNATETFFGFEGQGVDPGQLQESRIVQGVCQRRRAPPSTRSRQVAGPPSTSRASRPTATTVSR